MNATVLRVDRQSLLVRNHATGEEVLVFFRNPGAFNVGDTIRIVFNGQMTFSIPPQITATSIQRTGTATIPPPPGAGTGATEVTGTVVQVQDNFFTIRTAQGQLMQVNYSLSRHFCAGQTLRVRYDTITFSNPPRVTATQVFALC